MVQHLLAHILGIFPSPLQNSMMELIQSNKAFMKTDTKNKKGQPIFQALTESSKCEGWVILNQNPFPIIQHEKKERNQSLFFLNVATLCAARLP